MTLVVHRWLLVLQHAPARTEMSFQHISPFTGRQVLDSVGWPLSPDVKTERAYLAELYDGALTFMERRA